MSLMAGCCQPGTKLKKASSNASPAFKHEKSVFYDMPMFIEVFVIISFHFAVFLCRYANRHSCVNGRSNNGIGIITTVGKKVFGIKTFNQFFAKFVVCFCAFCERYPDDATTSIFCNVNLGMKPPFVRSMSWLPPTAPAAWGWTLTWEASISSHSSSGLLANVSSNLAQTSFFTQRRYRFAWEFQLP